MAWTEKYLDLSLGSGGDGSSGTPWGSYADAVTGLGTPSGPTMVRVKGSGTLGAALTLNTAGTAANPVWWRGCNSSFVAIADTDTTTTRPPLACGIYPVTVSGAFQVLSHLDIAGAQTANANSQLLVSGSNCLLYRCRVENTLASTNGRGLRLTGSDSRLVGCRIIGHTSGTYALNLAGSRIAVLGCAIRGGITGIDAGATSGLIFACSVRGVGSGDGIEISAAGALALNNTIYAPGRDGIRTSQACVVANNVVSGAGGYGYNYTGSSSISPLFLANGFYNCTSGGFASGITEDFRLYDPGTAGLLAGDPFTDAAVTDLSLTTHAKALGFPGFFEDESFAGYLDLGAVQREEPTGGGGGSAIYRRRMHTLGV